VNLCSSGHKEIVYEDKFIHCPMCEAMDELQALQNELKQLEQKIEELQKD